jgi:hypothetical protein
MKTFENRLQNIEDEIVSLFHDLDEAITKIEEDPNVYRPDLRYMKDKHNILKHMICGNFGYGIYNNSIIKNDRHVSGESYHLMNGVKLVDKYKK